MVRANEMTTSQELPRVAWHISTRSDANHASCVEAGPVDDGSGRVALRHSHHPGGATLISTGDEWRTFTAHIKYGQFDFPT